MLTLQGLHYDTTIHGYILDADYYTSMTAVSLADVLTADNATNIDAVITAYLRRASMVLYEYILSFNPRHRRAIQYMLSHDKASVSMIRECLVELVNYWTLNGIDTTITNPILNVDVERSVPVISQADLSASAMPLSVKTMIRNHGYTTRWKNISINDTLLKSYDNEEASYVG